METCDIVKTMNKEQTRDYCLSKIQAYSDFPFDQITEVFRLSGKMFALMGIDKDPGQINLKCDPPLGRDLRERYEAIKPGYHMNKEHWITVVLDGSLEQDMIKGLIDHSYQLIFKSLTKKKRKELGLDQE